MKSHNLIFFLKFSLILLFLLGCEKNEIFIDQSKTENLSDRISLDEAKKSFDFLESQKNKKKQTEKGGYSLPLFADWDKFQEERSSFDVIFSTVPVTLSNTQVKGDVIFLKYKGSITQYLFMTKELFDNEGEVIGNQLFLFDTEGVFIDAYKMENGIITKRLVLPWKANNRTRRSLHEEGCRASLLLQEDVGHVSKKLSNRPSGSGWEVGCGSIGGAGTEKDPFILSEVEVIHKKKDTQGPPSSFSVNNFYGFMPGNNQYFYNHFNNYKNEFDTDIYCGPTNIYFGVVIAKASNRIAEFKEFINSSAGLGSYDSPEKREVLSFAELHNFSEGAIGFVKKAITLLSKENRKYLIDIVDFKRKDSSLSVEQSIMLSILKGNPNPLTGKPIELYALLRYKNPTYFDVSFFSKGGENLTIGEYTLTPHYSANHKLVFYAAGRQLGYGLKNGIEYIIQPDALNDFRERIDLYTASANIFYLNGIPNQGQIALAAGDYIEGLTKMWGEALHSAEWWFSSITILADAVVSPFLKTSLPKNQQRLNQHFQKWQSAKNNLPAHHARDINVLWADYGYITRKLFDNAKNIFKATDDEIAQAAERIKAHRIEQNAGTSGNYGYLEGKIGNITKNGEMVRSGEPDKIKNIFIAEKVNSQQQIDGIGAWLRTTDSEYKMLNRLANELGSEKGKIYPYIKGELKIVSERAYCPSCQGVIQQFNTMFPNVKIILIDGVK